MKKTIEKLKYENKKLFKEHKEFETQCNSSPQRQQVVYNYNIPKAPTSKHKNFISKHKLRPSSYKSSKSSVFKSNSQHNQNNQQSLKNINFIKERLHSPPERNKRSKYFIIDIIIDKESDKFTGVPFKTYTLLQNSSQRSKISSPNFNNNKENYRNLGNLVPEKLVPQKTLDIRTKHDLKYNINTKWFNDNEVGLNTQ